MLLQLTVPVFGTYGALAVIGAWAADRHVSDLSVPIFVLLALGVSDLARLARGRVKPALLVLVAAAAICAVVSFYPVADDLTQTPHEATKDVAIAVNEREPQAVVTNSARPDGLRYYLDTPLGTMDTDSLQQLFCGPTTGYAFIDHPFKSSPADTGCLNEKGAENSL
jgi:hypothetical protein